MMSVLVNVRVIHYSLILEQEPHITSPTNKKVENKLYENAAKRMPEVSLSKTRKVNYKRPIGLAM